MAKRRRSKGRSKHASAPPATVVRHFTEVEEAFFARGEDGDALAELASDGRRLGLFARLFARLSPSG